MAVSGIVVSCCIRNPDDPVRIPVLLFPTSEEFSRNCSRSTQPSDHRGAAHVPRQQLAIASDLLATGSVHSVNCCLS